METPIALLGGTGKLGPGLALRFARAGVPVVIGSRDAEKGAAAAAEVTAKLSAAGEDAAPVEGTANLDAARRGRVAVITIPYEGHATLLPLMCSCFSMLLMKFSTCFSYLGKLLARSCAWVTSG